MPSRRRPRSRRAGRPRAGRTTPKKRLAHQRRTSKRRPIPLARLSERSRAARDRALHALAASRNDPSVPLTLIVKREGTKVETIKKFFPSTLKKVNGKLRVTKGDRYKATLYLPDAQGNAVAVKTNSSKERSEAGEYLRDVGRSLRGDQKALSKWRRKKQIAGVPLVTDERVLAGMEPALSDFSLYRTFNGGVA
jgi:hypothetical protein